MKTISTLKLVVKPVGWRRLPVFAAVLAALVLPGFSGHAETSAVTINISGNGTVTGTSYIKGDTVPANGALLNVGQTYALTARPAPNWFFANWTGTALSTVGATNGPTLKFVMQPGTTITANFITNIFVQMAGSYYGLFSNDTIMPTVETAGFISNLRFTSLGAYSAVVFVGGSARGITGYFTHDGLATNVATNTLLDGYVKVEFQMNTNNPKTIIGSVIGTNTIIVNSTNQAGWTSDLTMYASLTNTSNYARAYTMVISPSVSANGPTYGTGYACITNFQGVAAYRGNPAFLPYLSMIGSLPDWAGLTQTWPICADSAIPVFQNYYNTPNPGMLFGKVYLYTNSDLSPALSGTLTWVKRPSPFSLVDTNGFTNFPVVQGSYWSNLVPLDTVIATNSQLILSNIVPGVGVTNLVRVSYTNLLSQKGTTNGIGVTNYPYFYSAYVYPNTGELIVIFTNYSVPGARYAAGRGVVLQNSSNAAGFFLLGTDRFPTNIGSITLHPPP